MGDSIAEVLQRIVAALLAAPEGVAVGPPTREQTERLIGRAGDYQVVVGPALPVVPDSDVRRIPVWISWQMRRSEAPQSCRPISRPRGGRSCARPGTTSW